MFRYDRPQAGRYRQFWQFDVEAIGDPGPAIDAEIIELATRFYREVGLTGVEVQLNSIGDAACRPAYIAELTAYYRDHVGDLPAPSATASSATRCACSTRRTRRWPPLNAGGAEITDQLCDACAAHFEAVRAHLDARRACRTGSSRGLVRGLDYYTRTAFEFYRPGARASSRRSVAAAATTAWWSCSAASPTPGIGFGLGLDRVAARARRAGAARADRGARRRSPSSSGRIRRDTVDAAADRDGAARGAGFAAAPTWRRASWAGSSRRPAATAPTSR